MFYEVVAIARDWSLLLLVLQGMLLCALPLFVALKCVQGMRQLLPKVRPGLQSAQQAVRRILGGIDGALASARRPFVWLESAEAWARGFQRGLKRG